MVVPEMETGSGYFMLASFAECGSGGMPRPARISVVNGCYRVLNCGNGRREVFLTDDNSLAFMKLIGDAYERWKMRVLMYCLMPNHLRWLHPFDAGDGRWGGSRRPADGLPEA